MAFTFSIELFTIGKKVIGLKRAILVLFIASLIWASCGHVAHKSSYQIARNMNWGQLPLYGAEKNLYGFSDDLLYEVAKIEDFKVQLVNYNQNPVIDALKMRDVDAVLTAMQPTLENTKEYTFSDPYFVLGPVLLIRKGDSFHNLQDLVDRTVGFEKNYTWPLTLPGASGCVFHQYDDVVRAVEDLGRGLIDAVVLDSVVANKFAVGLYSNSVKVAGPPLIKVGIYLVVKKDKSDELVPIFNDALEQIKKEGLYNKMLYYWDLSDS